MDTAACLAGQFITHPVSSAVSCCVSCCQLPSGITINTVMKISEILQPKQPSAINDTKTLDVVAQDTAPSNRSAIMDGVSRVLRRVAGKGVKQGFRCTSGTRKGRVVANAKTCNARLNPSKGAKISQKRQAKAKQTAIKRSRTMRSGGASQRLKGIQIRTGKGTSPMGRSGKLLKSKFVKPAKSKKK